MQADTPAAIMLPLVARFLALFSSLSEAERVVIPTEAKRSEGICIFYASHGNGCPILAPQGWFPQGNNQQRQSSSSRTA